ncbi:hypothetical protein LINPERHAP1_LOCUS18290 [Linum perenne]
MIRFLTADSIITIVFISFLLGTLLPIAYILHGILHGDRDRIKAAAPHISAANQKACVVAKARYILSVTGQKVVASTGFNLASGNAAQSATRNQVVKLVQNPYLAILAGNVLKGRQAPKSGMI